MEDTNIDLIIRWITEGEQEPQKAENTLQNLDKQGETSSKSLNVFSDSLIKSAKGGATLSTTALSLASKLIPMTAALAVAKIAVTSLVGVIKQGTEVWKTNKDNIVVLTDALNRYTTDSYSYADAQNIVNDSSKENNITQKTASELLEKGVEKTRDLTTAQDLLNKANEIHKTTGEDIADVYDDLLGAYALETEVFDENNRLIGNNVEAVNKLYEQKMQGASDEIGLLTELDDKYQKSKEGFLTSFSIIGVSAEMLYKTISTKAMNFFKNYMELGKRFSFAIYDWFADISNKIPQWISNIWNNVASFLGNVMNKLPEWFKEKLQNIGNVIVSWINSNSILSNTIGKLFNISDSNMSNGIVSQAGFVNSGINGTDQLYLPSGANSFNGGTTNGSVINVNVEGSVWTTENLANELLSIFDDKVRLRGAY